MKKIIVMMFGLLFACLLGPPMEANEIIKEHQLECFVGIQGESFEQDSMILVEGFILHPPPLIEKGTYYLIKNDDLVTLLELGVEYLKVSGTEVRCETQSCDNSGTNLDENIRQVEHRIRGSDLSNS